jgi:protein-S-isoprenylcysteine O-methyltransferase
MSFLRPLMLSVRVAWLFLCLIWLAAEHKLARKNAVFAATVVLKEEQSQKLLWFVVVSCLALALLFKTLAWMPIPIAYLPRQLLALLLFLSGLYLRYTAIVRLGRFFTTNVAIQYGHQLIITGPYRWVRHPAYTGLLLAFAAIGLAMGDVIGLLLLTIPTAMALIYRINIEEKFMTEQFGKVYWEYRRTTKKLIPGLI